MEEDPLIPVFIPALVVLLLQRERAKGSQLTREEVMNIRDKGVCMMMRKSHASKMADSRGYDDLDPDFVWEQWQEVRLTLSAGSEPA
jgi:hypothetical protein